MLGSGAVPSGVRQKLQSCNVPKAFQGIPITLVAAAIVSVSFVGFGGVVEGMFNTGLLKTVVSAKRHSCA